MPKHILKLSADEVHNKIARDLALETYKLIASALPSEDILTLNQVLASFLGHFVEHTVKETLYAITPYMLTEDAQHKEVVKHFNALKIDIADNVAKGYTRASVEFSNMDVEYYCTIKLVPEPLTNTVN